VGLSPDFSNGIQNLLNAYEEMGCRVSLEVHFLNSYLIFILAPCILIIFKFLSPTNAPLYYTYKMLKYTGAIMRYFNILYV
jgi:hypothetical protein